MPPMQPLPADFAPESPDPLEIEAQAEAERKAADQRAAIVQDLGQRLASEFSKRKADRREIELRWLRDVRAYNGEYEPDVKERLEERKFGSRAFVPLTRRIANLVEARLGDLLFPTDDRNFVISASPVPELGDAEKLAKQLPPDSPVDAAGKPVQASQVGLALRDLREEAERRATKMQRVVDDQLQEANYSTHARRIIHDAIKLGTGIAKGPVVAGRVKKSWSVVNGVATLQMVEDLSPTVVRVDPWNFYPDLSQPELTPDSDVFELHPLSKVALVKLGKQPGFDMAAIARVLQAGDQQSGNDANKDAQRESSGTVGVQGTQWNLVEFTGVVSSEELEALGMDLTQAQGPAGLGDDGQAAEAVEADTQDANPQSFYSACVWFSEMTGEVIKAILYPLDTHEQPYSLFNWQPDTMCVFGYGLPYELRDLQEGCNSTYRAAMDNMGLSVGPQGVVNTSKIRPMNGNWQIEPNKLWDVTDPSMPVNSAMTFFSIDSKVGELLGLFNTIKGLADEIGGPMLAMQGQDAPKLAQAGATGMSIAYNAASVWMRRAVKLYDDQITTPMLGRFVDWNMQYNPDPDIKGDLQVIARGTSALLQAETQVIRLQTMMQLAQQSGVPVRRVISILRAMCQAMRLDAEDILPNDDEIKQMEAERAQQGPPPNPELERIKLRQADLQDQQAQREHDMQVEQMRLQARLAEIAERSNMTIQQVRERLGLEQFKVQANLADRREQRSHDAQALNAELAVKATVGSGV